jgi:hypothetical protein
MEKKKNTKHGVCFGDDGDEAGDEVESIYKTRT